MRPPDMKNSNYLLGQYYYKTMAKYPLFYYYDVKLDDYGIMPTIFNNIKKLCDEGLITATGNTRARKYELNTFLKKEYYEVVEPRIAEDVIWREKILPHMSGIKPNVLEICQYGFTEIVRNVFDHSLSKGFIHGVAQNGINIELWVFDHGVGIFNKIQKDFNLSDVRHALLELSKGKLTSDPKGHSGEGIFFTSRMFDDFTIYSNPLFYTRESRDNEWLVETGEDTKTRMGTLVTMKISPNSSRTSKSVFDECSDEETYGFTRTHIPIELAKYEGEQLVSRSQARRLLARFEQFKEVLLDFQGVSMIGQAFADEIFRVYHFEHPEVTIVWVNAIQDVEKMIKRVKANAPSEQRLLF